MVIYKNIYPRRTDGDFSNLESRDLPKSKNTKLASTCFFTGDTFFAILVAGVFYSHLWDPQDVDADSNASDNDCDIDNASKRERS